MNTSNHRLPTRILPNQLVYIRNNVRRKFDPLFGPDVYKVIDVKGSGVTLINLDDGKIVRRHLDDVKDATASVTAELETCWMDHNPTTQVHPQLPIALAPLPPNVPLQAHPPNIPVANDPAVVADAVGARPQRHRQPTQFYSDEHWEMEK